LNKEVTKAKRFLNLYQQRQDERHNYNRRERYSDSFDNPGIIDYYYRLKGKV